MGQELVFSLVFKAIDQATNTIGRVASALKGPTAAVGAFAKAAGDASQRFANSFTGMGSIVAEGFSVKAVAAQEEFFRRMQINTGMGDQAVGRLRKTMEEVTAAARISDTDMMDAFKSFKAAGGSVDAFEANANTVGAAIQLLGGHAEELGDMFATLQTKMALKRPEEFLDVLATIRKQLAGVEGGVDAFASSAPLLTSTYAALGHSGAGAAKELGATYALIAKGTGNARQARGLTEGFLTNLGDQGYQQHLASYGIKVWNDPSDPRTGVRASTDIIKQITQAYASDPYMAQQAFGKDLGAALKVPIGEIKNTGSSATMDRIFGTQGDSAEFMKSAQAASEGLTGSLNALQAAVHEVAKENLAEPINLFAKALSACTGLIGYVLMGLAGVAVVGHTIGWISGAVSGFKELGGVLKFLKFGGVITGLRGMVMALPAAIGAVGSFSAALLACPVTWIVAAIVAVAGAVYLIYRNWDGISAWWSAKWTAVKDAFNISWTEGVLKVLELFNPTALILDAMNSLVKWLTGFDLAEAGRKIIASLVDGMKEAFNLLPAPVRKALGGAWEGMKMPVAAVSSAAGSAWSGVKSAVGGAVSSIANSDTAKQAMSYFEKMGWSHQQAAGIAANLGAESGLKAGAVGDGGKAVGIAQWHPDRQRAFASFAGHDIRQSSLDEQLAFVHHELTAGAERGAGNALANAQSATEAGAIVSKLYERPADREGEAGRRAATADALARSSTASAFAGTPQKTALDGQITIRIDGLPDGAKATARSQTPGVALSLDLGQSMAGVA